MNCNYCGEDCELLRAGSDWSPPIYECGRCGSHWPGPVAPVEECPHCQNPMRNKHYGVCGHYDDEE